MKEITKFRKIRGLTQKELAELAGISKTTLIKIEQGLGNPRFSTLKKLTEALNVKIEFVDCNCLKGTTYCTKIQKPIDY
ncbi:MAG: helix-turn-helix domain-containing protein [Vallitalea sp.]|jgi:transcriptional regulator with XRE-family HTH domain|nr:helix-turn-helix domain-containing protein [Vallitalea sp.]